MKVRPESKLVQMELSEYLRNIAKHSDSLEEKLKNLIEPKNQRVSFGHIASYLGITQETLRRIKRFA
jgi:hypothetical protein